MSRDKLTFLGRKHMTDDKLTTSDSAEAEVVKPKEPATFGSKVAQPEATPATLVQKNPEAEGIEMSDAPEAEMEVEMEAQPVEPAFSDKDFAVIATLEEKLARIKTEMRNAQEQTDTNFFALVCEGGTLHALTGCETSIIAQAFAQIIFAENNILIDLVAALLSDRETAILLPNVLHTMQEAINAVAQAEGSMPINPVVPADEKH